MAVTLLELLLALALSVVVLTAIGMAINLHFKMLDVRRTSTEEMQVVRVVTLKLTQDIRMMVQPNKPDLSGLEAVMANAMTAATKQAEAALAGTAQVIGGAGSTGIGGASGGGGGQGQGGGAQAGQSGSGTQSGTSGNLVPKTTRDGQFYGMENPGAQAGKAGGGAQGGQASGGAKAGAASGGAAASGSSASGSASSSQSSSSQSGTTGTTTESTATTSPGVQLIGSATELRFDISRLPRVDQYKGMFTNRGELSPTDLPSDVKTIAYFIRSESSAATYIDDPHALGGEASTDGYGRGLMRVELDRAVTTYAETGGLSDAIYTNARLLADEVVGLGFEYWDGTEFLTEWDSTTSGTLPRAIKVWLSLQPTYGMSEEELANYNANKETPTTDFYFVISLPTAPVVTPIEIETTESSGTTDAASGAATSGTAGGTTSGSTATQGTMP